MPLVIALSVFAASLGSNVALVPPAAVDGLLWGVVPTTGQSCPFVTPPLTPRPKFSHLTAFGALDDLKYDGVAGPTIAFDSTDVFLEVTPLDAKSAPLPARTVRFRGTAENNSREFAFDTWQRWDAAAAGGAGAEVPFMGFAAGFYRIKVVAKVRLVTPATATPKADERTEKRDAILMTTPFQFR